MSKLTSYARAHLRKSSFALPRHRGESRRIKGHYPIPDRSHGRAALQRGAQMLRRGKLTRSEYATIRRRVHARFPGIHLGKPATTRRRVTAAQAHRSTIRRVTTRRATRRVIAHRATAHRRRR